MARNSRQDQATLEAGPRRWSGPQTAAAGRFAPERPPRPVSAASAGRDHQRLVNSFGLTLLRQQIAGSFRSDRKFLVERIDAGSPA